MTDTTSISRPRITKPRAKITMSLIINVDYSRTIWSCVIPTPPDGEWERGTCGWSINPCHLFPQKYKRSGSPEKKKLAPTERKSSLLPDRPNIFIYVIGSRAGAAYILINPLTAKLKIGIFTHLKLCLADAIHYFKWVKIIQIWQNGGQLFSYIADWCHILSLTCLKGGT